MKSRPVVQASQETSDNTRLAGITVRYHVQPFQCRTTFCLDVLTELLGGMDLKIEGISLIVEDSLPQPVKLLLLFCRHIHRDFQDLLRIKGVHPEPHVNKPATLDS